MLWDAGQKRMARESRDRRAELFEAVRDAFLHEEIAVGRVKLRGAYRLPEYLAAERDPEDARRGLRALVAAHGGTIGTETADAMRAAFAAQVAPEADQVH